MPKKKTVKKVVKSTTDGVPDKVATQAAEADELQRRLAAGEALDGTETRDATLDAEGNLIVPAGDAQAAVAPDLTDPAAIAAKAAADKVTADAATAAAATAQEFPRVDPGAVDVPAVAAPAAGNDLVTLQSRFDVLEGKYNTEIARMTTALSTSQNIINQQESMIKGLQTNPGVVATETPAKKFEKLNPDDYSSYGSEMEKMASLVNNLVAENESLRASQTSQTPGTQGENDRIAKVEKTVQNLGNTVQMSAKQTYYQALDNAIVSADHKPEWEAINHDPRFATWLGAEEPLTGIPRKAILIKANTEMNAERVISIFTEFKRSLQGGQMPNNASTEDTLAQQAVPGTAAAGEDIDPGSNKQGLTTTEMFLKAKNDFVQGRILEADFDKVSNSYQESIAKGWVQPQ
jgi:hypothetical protein